MSTIYPINTGPLFMAASQFELKPGERFTVLLSIPSATGIDWTGISGDAAITDGNGTAIATLSNVSGTVLGDASAQVVFDWTGSTTASWVPGVYYFDARWKVSTTYGPVATKTYKLTVGKGPTT